MREHASQTVRNTLRFLADLRHNGLEGEEILDVMDRLIRGDALIESTQQIYLDEQQVELISNGRHPHNAKFHDGHSEDGAKRLKNSPPFGTNAGRQTLFHFVMRMREAKRHEKMAVKNGDKLAAYGLSCRAQVYDEVCAELKARGFGLK